MRKKVCACKREKMGVDMWTGGREVAGKVSLCHFFLPTQAEKPDTAPKTQWVQRPAFLSKGVVLQGLSQCRSTPKATRGKCVNHPCFHPAGSVWKAGKAKA